MKLRFTGLSNPGLVRFSNQDAYYIDPEGRFFIVADGMGGHTGGEEASRIATQVIRDYLLQHWQSDLETKVLLENAFKQANLAIVREQKLQPQCSDMGTTAVTIVFREQQPAIAHVGDSRLYLFREAALQQVTTDHTWINMALHQGDISKQEARNHPWRHILSRCLGREELDLIDIQTINVQLGDRLLLCSDGLTEELSDEHIAFQLQSHPAIEKAPAALLEAALASGGKDNITVVLIALE
ncbi:Stp1/IreP family PP2C-type Ser/Thr phosphatase [Gloeocapsopsis sp. IPPAS B-1203]|uniref:Stp1/IreP family PP2C-type Ser/Thr phosphatase n=1 Tax=Gloeocapsopsis sp. IPPAS B-1203 TaxID=2049454 RepID=UPI000C19B707|nr:Stp1/IreP family PP2C-type Ser/Thr phosphatase [Gloeocapsopsis sp. IPPAS B-1203]PIG94132.1 serine/threonine protein phosphatase [Gloeocapsopsis sp. IPPAS B-1203]